MEIDAFYYLILSTVMMFAGIYGFFTRRNLLATLISVELMLNATNINFAVFNRYFIRVRSKAISSRSSALPSRRRKRLWPLPL